MLALLEVVDVNYSSGSRHILEDVSLRAEAGEITCVVGVNGTGKSTLAAMIMGLNGYKPSSGRIFFKGKDITNLSVTERARRGMTLAWQSPAEFEGITVREYLSLGKKDPSELLRRVGLDPKKYIDRQVDSRLSGGERKRIELASVMSVEPSLAILDEPDSGIDMASINVITSVIKDLRESGAGVLLITHSEAMAKSADKVVLMCRGRVLREGSVDDVVQFFSGNCVECDHVGKIDERLLNGRS